MSCFLSEVTMVEQKITGCCQKRGRDMKCLLGQVVKMTHMLWMQMSLLKYLLMRYCCNFYKCAHVREREAME